MAQGVSAVRYSWCLQCLPTPGALAPEYRRLFVLDFEELVPRHIGTVGVMVFIEVVAQRLSPSIAIREFGFQLRDAGLLLVYRGPRSMQRVVQRPVVVQQFRDALFLLVYRGFGGFGAFAIPSDSRKRRSLNASADFSLNFDLRLVSGGISGTGGVYRVGYVIGGIWMIDHCAIRTLAAALHSLPRIVWGAHRSPNSAVWSMLVSSVSSSMSNVLMTGSSPRLAAAEGFLAVPTQPRA